MIFRCDICGKTITEIKDYDPGCPACREKLAGIAFDTWGVYTGLYYYEFRERFMRRLEKGGGRVMHLTREEAINLFREHWTSLADTGSPVKEAFPRSRNHKLDCDCYLCQYADQHRQGYSLKCDSCPILWPQIRPGAEPSGNRCTESFFYYWRQCDSLIGRKRLARIISELPEKEGKK